MSARAGIGVAARRIAALVAAALLAAGVTAAQEESGPIADNSFLVEEAYNQESRVVQHISNWTRFRGDGAWVASFTQEWPAVGQRHQLSYTIPMRSLGSGAGNARGIGDVALHYRYQALGMGGGRVAFAPRLTALLPTGDADRGLGAPAAGVQVNLPLSTTLARRWVAHTNAGATYLGAGDAGDPPTRAINLAQSLIWLAAPRVNLMLELAYDRAEAVDVAGDADLEQSLLLAPGVRWSHDFASGLQIVPGVAAPIGLGPSRGVRAVLLYLSFEHGF